VSTFITGPKEMACTAQEQMSKENKQIRRGRKKFLKSVNLLPNITGWGIKADGMRESGSVCCILAQCPVTKILIQVLGECRLITLNWMLRVV
jgi:hypothetical protein